ncbi:MAG: hypothetical protein IT305_24110 [Chloroflexi bacterium]|nr:hypothetical protein [Chloroflexota bacterium]
MMLRPLIVVLALADGILHFALNFVLFRGNLLGPLPFQSPFPLPLNQLFTLNLIGYVMLVAAFWYAPRFLGSRRWLMDLVLIVYTALSIIGWAYIGMPNPRGLGYVAKGLEIALIAALAAHIWRVGRPALAMRRLREGQATRF